MSVLSSLATWSRNLRLRLSSRFGRTSSRPTSSEAQEWTLSDWQERYTEWDLAYANGIYDLESRGGQRETILDEQIQKSATTAKISGFFNPISVIVDTYLQVLRGRFGQDIRIATDIGVDSDKRPVNPQLRKPVYDILRWSNFDVQKDVYQHLAAKHGMVGLKIEATVGDTPEASRVRLIPMKAGDIVDFNMDAQGNVTDVKLEYKWQVGELDGSRSSVTIEELLTKEQLTRSIDGGETTTVANGMGLCPFVILNHKDVGADRGVPAHYGSDRIMHQINWLLSRMGISVDRHVFAKWFAFSSGAEPTSFPMDDTTVAYVQMQPGDTKPELLPLVAKLDFAGCNQIVKDLVAHFRHRQPELTLAFLESLSGQSGETISKLLIPCEQKILEARSRYEDVLVRALKIGLSWGIGMEMWNLGTGMGSKETADAAYTQGLEDFVFNERSALPETLQDKALRAKADMAPDFERANVAKTMDGFASKREQMKMMGWEDARIKAAMDDMAAMDTTVNNSL